MKLEKETGFTLIEVMITVAIVGILAAIAYPSYVEQVRRTRRADAQGALLGLSNAMERYFTGNNRYTRADGTAPALCAPAPALCAPGEIFPSEAPLDGATKYYTLSIPAITPTNYTLLATPIAGGPQAGDGPLRLGSTGARGWDKAGDGSFAHPW